MFDQNLIPFEQKHFDENAEENLPAAVHIQCRIFKPFNM